MTCGDAISHRWSANLLGEGAKRYAAGTGELIGYARSSTVLQGFTAQRDILTNLGVAGDRIYFDKGLTGTNRKQPGLDQALAAVRVGDTLVVPELGGSSAPSLRPATLATRGVRLSLGGSVYDPAGGFLGPLGGELAERGLERQLRRKGAERGLCRIIALSSPCCGGRACFGSRGAAAAVGVGPRPVQLDPELLGGGRGLGGVLLGWGG
ncbi:recombinase family protein [Actinomadura sp. NPDC048955]|uniref:recombinase family protein n=1 Tax=Actinomadura sp. NPDC048955 TaxID=3158228 RepID=UPI0033E9E75B